MERAQFSWYPHHFIILHIAYHSNKQGLNMDDISLKIKVFVNDQDFLLIELFIYSFVEKKLLCVKFTLFYTLKIFNFKFEKSNLYSLIWKFQAQKKIKIK